jgi:hypothetical protein
MNRLALALYLWLANVAAVPTQQVTWTQPDITPSRAQVLIYRLTITEEGNPTPRVVGLTNVLCGGSDNAAECSTVLPAAAQSAIISGNRSTLMATNPETGASSGASAAFTGNQGCIFRDTLYAVGARANAQASKQQLNTLLSEFHAAKFDHISTTNLKGNAWLVVEECVGYLAPERKN